MPTVGWASLHQLGIKKTPHRDPQAALMTTILQLRFSLPQVSHGQPRSATKVPGCLARGSHRGGSVTSWEDSSFELNSKCFLGCRVSLLLPLLTGHPGTGLGSNGRSQDTEARGRKLGHWDVPLKEVTEHQTFSVFLCFEATMR